MQIIDNREIETTEIKPILSVVEFCRRYRLDDAEESRLRKLFGEFASRHELLMNAQRKAMFR
jgi:Asp-tRNA(Asn)/Glu-tRNA(Gln) amidotransferase C subunit